MLLYILMIASAVGMFYANIEYRRKGVVWGRPVAGVLGAITLGLALFKIYSVINQPNRIRETIIAREKDYFYSTMSFLGDYLATNFSGHRVLLISNPVVESNREQQEEMMNRLEATMGEKLNILARRSPLKLDVDAVLDESEGTEAEGLVFTADSFDLMQSMHPECNLIVSLIGLPRDYKNMKFWSMNPLERPKLVVMFGDTYELKNAITMGYIAAIITYNRAYRPKIDDVIPPDYKEAFNKRFILITKDNVDEIVQEFPGIFMADDDSE